MEAWDSYLPPNGTKTAIPTLPSPALAVDGSIEANGFNANFLTGTITTPINLGGKQTAGIGIVLDGTNRKIVTYNGVTPAVTVSQEGIFAGATTFAAAPFSVDLDGNVIANQATIAGTITANAGAIGGFSVGSDYIRDAANSFGLASTVTGGDDVRFWAGATFANRATAPFRLTEAGLATIVGGTFQSATSGKRVVISGNRLEAYDSGGVLRFRIDNDDSNGTILFYDSAATLKGGIIASDLSAGAGSMSFAGVGGYIYFNQQIKTNGGIVPEVDNSVTCGATGLRWSEVWAANGTIQTSDARFKDFLDYMPGIEFIKRLNPMAYTWKKSESDDTRIHFGFAAQEVEDVLPDMVYGDEENGYALNYSEFIAPMVRAIQDLADEVESLKYELESLKITGNSA